MEIEQSNAGIKVIQPKYVVDMLLKFKMAECKETKFPFLSGIKLGDFGASPLVDRSLYKQLGESLLYLTRSRLDLEYAIGSISIYIQEPHDIQCKYTKIILHYVQGTKHFGVHYVASSPLELVGFTDFDWVRNSINRKYTLGYVFMLSHGPICWSRKKQHIISLSSVEIEYKGAVNIVT